MRIVALIPARAGSKRIPGKNTKLLGGKPLLFWTLNAARDSGVFSQIIVSTDDASTNELVWECWPYPREFHARLSIHATDDAPDILWVKDILSGQATLGGRCGDIGAPDAFAILRPTTPFRTAGTIRDAWDYFRNNQPADSLRAVRFAKEPPQKMWVPTLGGRMVPLLPFSHPRADARGPIVPWHSSPTQTLPGFFVQTAGLEIAWVSTVTTQQSISGTSVLSYLMPPDEELDINTPEDWDKAEAHAQTLLARVP